MDLTYMVRGADTKEYGPATLEQITGWIQEGRIPAHQLVKRSDMGDWAKAGDFLELQPSFGIAPAPAMASPAPLSTAMPAGAVQAQALGAAQARSGGSWFYWIAGLSLINSISAFLGTSWRFIVGLGLTQLFDAAGTGMGSSGKVIVLVLDLFVAGLFVLFGVFAVKGHLWAFIIGMVLFTLDALVFLLVQDWIGVGFHAFVLYCLFRGFQGSRLMNRA